MLELCLICVRSVKNGHKTTLSNLTLPCASVKFVVYWETQAMSAFIKKQTGFPGKYHYYPGRSTMGVFLAAFFTIVLIVATVFFLSMIMSGKPESR